MHAPPRAHLYTFAALTALVSITVLRLLLNAPAQSGVDQADGTRSDGAVGAAASQRAAEGGGSGLFLFMLLLIGCASLALAFYIRKRMYTPSHRALPKRSVVSDHQLLHLHHVREGVRTL